MRARVLQALAVLLLAISLLTSGIVMAEPLRAHADEYAESGVLRLYSERLGLDLDQIFPMFMSSTRYKDKGWDDKQEGNPGIQHFLQFKALTSPAGLLVLDQGAVTGWATHADGRTGGVLLGGPDASLPAGAYELSYRLKLEQMSPEDRVVGLITVRAGDETIARRELKARDLGVGVYQDITLAVVLAERQEICAELTVPAGSALWADEVLLKPLATWPARIKGALWGAALLACSVCGYWRWGVRSRVGGVGMEERACVLPPWAYPAATALLATLTMVVFLRFWYSYVWAREYEAEGWATQTGQATDDAAASGGRAMAGKVGVDQPGWLSYGPYEILAAGDYEVSFWVKRGELDVKDSSAATAIAFAEATDVSGQPIFGRREVRLEDVPLMGEYTRLAFRFTNPKWQKLVFRVYFLGAADLQFDRARFVRLLR